MIDPDPAGPRTGPRPQGTAPSAASELRVRWRTLTGAVLAMAIGVAALPYYTSGLFMKALQSDFGWTRAQVSLGPTLLIAGLVVTAPVIGYLTDRIGARRLIAPGLVALALCYIALSRLEPAPAMYWALMGGMALLAAGSGTPTVTRIVAESFDSARGTALGAVLAGIGVASAVATPLLAQVIERHGWRNGYLALAAATLIGMPLALWLLSGRERHETRQQRTAPTGARFDEAVRDPVLWILGVCFFLVALASAGLIVHLVPLLTDRGASVADAAATAAMVGLCIIAARLITGVLIDRWFAPRVAAGLVTLGAIAFLLFGFGGPAFAAVGAVGIGLSFGAEVDLIGYTVSRYFGFRAYGRLYGLLYAICMAGTATSPLVYGLVADRAGGYEPMLAAAVAMLLFAAGLFLTLRPFDARTYDDRDG
jgi:predicted MFS family arabinose efflux permease